MKTGTAALIRLAAGIAALGFLSVMPMTDRLIGGNELILPQRVYGQSGDADGSGVIDLQDVQVIRDIYSGRLTPDDNARKAADINSDGQITSDDAGILLLYLSDPAAVDMQPDAYYQIKKNGESAE